MKDIKSISKELDKILKEKNMTRYKIYKQSSLSHPSVCRVLEGNENYTIESLLSILSFFDLELSFKKKEKLDG